MTPLSTIRERLSGFRTERIGDCLLVQGDCLEVLPLLEGGFDALISDPPYEIPNKFGIIKGRKGKGTRALQFHFDKDNITQDVVLPALSIALQKVKSFHVFCGLEQFGNLSSIVRDIGFTPKPYAKLKSPPPPPMHNNWWPSGFEVACYGYRTGAYFGDKNPNRVNIFVGDSYRNGIRAEEKVEHPTQKWLPMLTHIVKSIVPKGGVALDPFMGSGTTGVACVQLGRAFIGVEIEPKYFDIAVKRIREAYAQPDIFIEAKRPAPV